MVECRPDCLGRLVKAVWLVEGRAHLVVAEMVGLLLLRCLEDRQGGMDDVVVYTLLRLLLPLLVF